ncbi:unnamed protein product [Ceutorhynchus assimilis]|uniref:Uncharacterized protein n=1 Tax=Ceutorhynchus assimilis TaxID=467358 RepID=A0A9N9QNJ1_9CUCU|nr:unnamed protein product [Ceutorhynchus assimilis]
MAGIFEKVQNEMVTLEVIISVLVFVPTPARITSSLAMTAHPDPLIPNSQYASHQNPIKFNPYANTLYPKQSCYTPTATSNCLLGNTSTALGHRRLNQDSGLVTLMPTVGQLEDDVDFVPVKTRSVTPDDSSGAPYWMPPSGANVGGTPRHPMDGCGETGFISSQPSMAEFMTALPHLSAEMPPHGAPMSPQHTPPGNYGMEVPHGLGSPGVNVHEYPWMKEKKTTRKNSQQEEELFEKIPEDKETQRKPQKGPPGGRLFNFLEFFWF